MFVKAPESEKITVNLGFVDLGQIDLLVLDGFYSNRTDFIRTAIRSQLDRQSEMVRHSRLRRSLEVGLREITKAELDVARQEGKRLSINVVGLATFDPSISPALAQETIESITVLGGIHASPALRAALADRIVY